MARITKVSRKAAAPKRRIPDEPTQAAQDAICGSDEEDAMEEESLEGGAPGKTPPILQANSLSGTQQHARVCETSNAAASTSLGFFEVVFAQPVASQESASTSSAAAAVTASPAQLSFSLVGKESVVHLNFTSPSSGVSCPETDTVQVGMARQ